MMKVKKVGIMALSAVLAASASIPAYATSESDLNNAIAANEESQSELYTVQERLQELESKKGESEEYLQAVNDQLNDLQDQLIGLQEEYSDKQTQLDLISQELEEAKADEAVQRENMAIRIQYVYENSTETDQLTAVLGAQSFTEMLNAAENISELNEYDRNALQEYVAICEDIEIKQSEVLREQEEIAELSEQCNSKKEELVTIYDETKTEVEEIAADIDLAEGEASQLLASIQSYEEEILLLKTKASEEVAAAELAAGVQASASESYVVVQETDASASYSEDQTSGETADVQTVADETEYVEETVVEETVQEDTSSSEVVYTYDGEVLTRTNGRVSGPAGGQETYYNLDMSGVVSIMRNMGNTDEYWVRDDGAKMLGDYIMVAANLSVHPRGSYVETTLGTGIVCDTGGFAINNPYSLDIATNW